MRRKNLWNFLKGLIYVQLFVAVIVTGMTFDFQTSLTGMAREGTDFLIVFRPFSRLAINQEQAQTMVFQSYAGFACAAGQGLPVPRWLDSAGLRLGPEDILCSHIQAMAWTENAGRDISEPPEREEETEPGRNDDRLPVASPELEEVRLVFYCTHNGESYRPDTGKSRVEGRGLITRVAAHLQQETERRGFSSEYIDTIHDYPDFTKSYANSRVTVQQIVDSKTNLGGIFDIHRDALPEQEATTVKIAGREAAQILIIVGTDERKPHPNWQKNASFARQLFRTGERLYPGLIKGVRTKAGTYNQEFHEHALLLEIGSDSNSLDEALYASELFADILCEVFKELN